MKKILKILCKQELAIGLLILNAVLLIIYTPAHYYFEMFQSMAFQFLIGIMVLFLFFLFNKRWAGSLSVLLAIFLLILHLPLYESTISQKSNISIAHFNVLKWNNSFNKTILAAIESDADFISFNEVSPDWAKNLEPNLCEIYPYSYIKLASNNSFGIAVFSKNPLTELAVHYWGNEEIPTITGKVRFIGTTINFVAAHTIPPVTKHYYSIRNNHLHAIKDYFTSIEGSKILVGDLNAVSWSAPLAALRSENKLKDSRQSWLPTYPAWFQLVAIPIDHIFYSQDMHCTDFYTIKSTDSDHYGIVGKFYLNELLVKN